MSNTFSEMWPHGHQYLYHIARRCLRKKLPQQLSEIQRWQQKRNDFWGQKVDVWQCINTNEGLLEHAVRSRGTEGKSEKMLGEGGWMGLEELPRASVCGGRVIPVPWAGTLSWLLLWQCRHKQRQKSYPSFSFIGNSKGKPHNLLSKQKRTKEERKGIKNGIVKKKKRGDYMKKNWNQRLQLAWYHNPFVITY